MAHLRIVRYGHPVDPSQFVDLGPSVGRVTHTRGAIISGSPIVTETERERLNRQTREYKARRREGRG